MVESPDLWFMDDGALTKIFCPEENESLDEQSEILDECCACDEARYDLIFQGLWSKNTHPRDFPENPFYSDVLGGSHTNDLRIWEYGGYASEGLRMLAEDGNMKKMEAELQTENAQRIR